MYVYVHIHRTFSSMRAFFSAKCVLSRWLDSFSIRSTVFCSRSMCSPLALSFSLD